MQNPDITLPKTPQIKSYVAMLNQSSTNAPTTTILHNTLGTIIWTREGTGQYLGTLTGSYDLTKVYARITQNSGASVAIYSIYPSTNTGTGNIEILIETQGWSGSWALEDNWLFYTPIKIELYS